MKRVLAIAALCFAFLVACAGLASAQSAYIGEVRAFGFNYCPAGWLPAQGQTLSIAQNNALFMLFGTTYGGNGTATFALPNLQGQTPVGASAQGMQIGNTYPKAATANQPNNSQFGGLALTWCVAVQGVWPTRQ